MIKILLILIILQILVQTTFAAKTLAVLEINPKAEIDAEVVSFTEMRHLTDELRRQAVQILPQRGYSVLTRDNLIALMPADEAEADCLAESCAVQIGRAIGAEYVSQGNIGRFGGELSVSIELYETMSGRLLGSIVVESQDVKGLLIAIREQAPALFSRILSDTPPSGHPSVRGEVSSLDSSPTSTPQKSNSAFTIALSLDFLGAAVIGFGIYQHINANKLYDDYKNMTKDFSPEECERALEKANSAKQKRNTFYTIGSTLLASGIFVHIWF